MLLETEYLNQEHLNGFDKYKVSWKNSTTLIWVIVFLEQKWFS